LIGTWFGEGSMFKKVITLIKYQGLKGLCLSMINRIKTEMRVFFDRGFDLKHGVNTSGCVWPKNLDIKAEQKLATNQYEPTPAPVVRVLLKKINIDYSKYTFIDFGSG
jgi:hypothetical protein